MVYDQDAEISFEVFEILCNTPPKDQRPGQWAFNVLHTERPYMANNIRGTVLDPYHDDDRLPAFMEFLKESW